MERFHLFYLTFRLVKRHHSLLYRHEHNHQPTTVECTVAEYIRERIIVVKRKEAKE